MMYKEPRITIIERFDRPHQHNEVLDLSPVDLLAARQDAPRLEKSLLMQAITASADKQQNMSRDASSPMRASKGAAFTRGLNGATHPAVPRTPLAPAVGSPSRSPRPVRRTRELDEAMDEATMLHSF